MTILVGGGGGVGPTGATGPDIAGLTSDTQTPGGIVVAGAAEVGDSNAALVPSMSVVHGQLGVIGTRGNDVDNDSLLFVSQSTGLSADSAAIAVYIGRGGALNGHTYTSPLVVVVDHTQIAHAVLVELRDAFGTSVLQANVDGGLGLFGVTPPTAPRTLPQATITAIIDANAKAGVQACANALSDMGALTLT